MLHACDGKVLTMFSAAPSLTSLHVVKVVCVLRCTKLDKLQLAVSNACKDWLHRLTWLVSVYLLSSWLSLGKMCEVQWVSMFRNGCKIWIWKKSENTSVIESGFNNFNFKQFELWIVRIYIVSFTVMYILYFVLVFKFQAFVIAVTEYRSVSHAFYNMFGHLKLLKVFTFNTESERWSLAWSDQKLQKTKSCLSVRSKDSVEI